MRAAAGRGSSCTRTTLGIEAHVNTLCLEIDHGL